ncbi:ATP-grasp domain-containing protein [Natranaerobius thermophilus]|uniref:ATP-grasp domain-containing protein n=1 Tax=Natranaerobius thermophilus (strain ATCC BAA-1301 / DSM 18059 / JW/NM-WN-LF) TaxID=457570 RepID=B2A4K9_NATTJ|nr:ATP-grasp domain-containing protein [Natranaerobius thermophilus]ACB85184.1 hypothetical protein Nther_1610 [Natranaerobius thermophilus JW/NM-WN-LF]
MTNFKKKKVLILCQESEVPIVEESLSQIEEYEVETETTEDIFLRGPEEYLKEMIDTINEDKSIFDGVIGTRDVTSVFANVICEMTGKPATSIESMINCQNKYISRTIQAKYIPNSTPDFWLDSNFLKEFPLVPPFFAKPVRANVSYSSKKCHAYDELRELIRSNTAQLSEYNQYYLDSLAVSSHLKNQLNLETYNRFICEEVIAGEQATVNGYIYNGEINLYGIVKAVFHEDKISFSHHEWPYENLSKEMEAQIQDTVSTLVKGLQLDNTFFNVELRIEEDLEKINIIEVNSRAAFQFAKMTEAIMGINYIQWLCDLAVGKQPRNIKEGENLTYKHCYNFELREFSDKEIVRVPMTSDLEQLKRMYPEVTIKNLVNANTRLSDYKQNLESYRYCILDIPGNSQKEVLEKYEEVTSQLGYEFRD